MPRTTPQEYVHVSEAATILGVTPKTVYKRLKDGRLRGRKKKTSTGLTLWLVLRASVTENGGTSAAVATAQDIKKSHPAGTTCTSTAAEKYEARRRGEAARHAEQSEAGRDIGEIPLRTLQAEYDSCRLNLRLFLETAFPQAFCLAWSEDHIEIISEIERTILNGGTKAICMPRGFGKTSIIMGAAIWALCYAHRLFVVVITSEKSKGDNIISAIKTDLEVNQVLFSMFPEVCYPISRLEGISSRARAQHCKGVRTRMRWGGAKVVFPTIEGAPTSGAVLLGAGITSSQIRGPFHKQVDGTIIRPDFFLADDCQDDESAASPIQCQFRENVMCGAVMGMAGPTKTIAGFNLCTVIYDDDLTSRILQKPEWHGKVYSVLKSMPKNLTMWEHEYNDLRLKSLKKHKDIRLASEFYRAHHDEMTEGAAAAWDLLKKPGETDAIESAMLLYLENERSFWAERMNKPKPKIELSDDQLTPDCILRSIVAYPRGIVPQEAVELVAFIDVHTNLLYYTNMAAASDFSCHVVDYGTFPEQAEQYFTQENARKTLTSHGIAAQGLEALIYSALEKLTALLFAREFDRDGGGKVRISRIHIDAGWLTGTIYQFIRESTLSPLMLPTNGRFLGAKSAPMALWQKHPGERPGQDWLRSRRGKHGQRHLVVDTNAWKEFMFNRFRTPPGSPGRLTLFSGKKEVHQMYADHICSEYRVRVEAARTVYEWSKRPNTDNHFLDTTVGCMVAASYQGIKLAGDIEAAEHSGISEREIDTQRAALREQNPATGTPVVATPGEKKRKKKIIDLSKFNNQNFEKMGG